MTDSDSGDGNPTQQPQFLPTRSGNNPSTSGSTNNDQSNLSNDYNDYDDDITQYADLPEETPTKMMKIRELKKHNTKNPRGWAILVECTLMPLYLKKTIDSNIPRPAKGHPKYTRWAFWSRVVAGWMYTQRGESRT